MPILTFLSFCKKKTLNLKKMIFNTEKNNLNDDSEEEIFFERKIN
jgi:hypothetical protein